MLQTILKSYNLDINAVKITPFGSGLINHTWRIEGQQQVYILQRINDAVFKNPQNIADNIQLIGEHLRIHSPDYLFVSPIKNTEGSEMTISDDGFFRLFPFVEGSHSIDVVTTPEQAFEAARQFGQFTFLLRGIEISKIKTTIPQFHDLSLRYRQFQEALVKGNKARIEEAQEWIRKIEKNVDIVHVFENIKTNTEFKLRITHHDTKISNVLFDKNDKGLCVIDLDTIMAGYFISDVGDMMRTYLSPVSEEEIDFSQITVRKDFYQAITEGYFSEMKNALTTTEKQYFAYSGEFMIYMQALRFLTDYLNDDAYYGAKYPKHNLNRAINQLVLLHEIQLSY
ncbi:MAG: aminoglycoside phosphotransferase family protein [Saprospiraceae bacterium]|nr:aminoglycoside phosphotransferase family protein [Saprospiraceae bacterium]